MERDEFAALMSSGGQTYDPGPIERHLQALASEPDLPDLAVAMCAIRFEEAGPALRAILARAADGEILSENERRLAFRGLHLLGGARDTEAWPILSRLLRRPSAEIRELIGDAVTETLPRIATGMFNGDVDDLFGLIADRSINEYARSSLFGAAAYLAWEGRIEQARMREFLERFHSESLADHGEYAWAGWLEAISLLGLRDLVPLFDRAWEEGRIDPAWLDRKHFEKDLVRAEAAPGDIDRFTDSGLGYIEDVLEVLPRTDGMRDLDNEQDITLPAIDWTPSEPYINPLRGIGRNDPCPCGSGKKAKKCCLS